MAGGDAPITDDELLYRRVLVPEHFDARIDSRPSPKAFRPLKTDTSGLSLYRAAYVSPQQVASAGRRDSYAIAVLRAKDLRAHGIEVVPRPLPDSPGHAELPDLTYENRKNNQQETGQKLMGEELCRMEGPFPPENEP